MEINEPLSLPSKYQNPVAELESRLVLKVCFSILFGDNMVL